MFAAWFEPFDEIMFLTLLSPWLRVFHGLSVSRKQGGKHWSFLPNQRVQYCSVPTGGSVELHQLFLSLSLSCIIIHNSEEDLFVFPLLSPSFLPRCHKQAYFKENLCFLASCLVYPLAFKLSSLRHILPLVLWHEEFPFVHPSSRLPLFFLSPHLISPPLFLPFIL